MQPSMFAGMLICLALSAVSARPLYIMALTDQSDLRLPQQGVLESMVSEMLRVQSVEQQDNNQVRRQIFSRKFW